MKKLVQWSDEYSINNAELDKHHEILFGILNKLYDNCAEADNTISLKPVINELISYTNYHFLSEEQHMISIGYNEVDNHISQHSIFIERIVQLQHEESINDYERSKELIVYLGNWLFNHVLIEDSKLINR
jgi:hemerythrin-like metal-binding protein